MNRYLKLVNFELSRFMKIYLVLAAITIIAQITGVIVKSNEYLGQMNEALYQNMMSEAQFLEQYGQMSFMTFARSLWFMGPIALSAVALIIYIFMIWYRDWFGKNTFIYRLLMLPTARVNVYLAKATSIFLMTLGLVALQLLLLPLESRIMQWMIPHDFLMTMSVDQMAQFNYLTVLVPQTFIEFLLSYGIGFMAVTILFTAILFERSFRWKGILLGAGYSITAVFLFILPLLSIGIFDQNYLYPLEMIGVEIVLGVIITAVSIWLGGYLLRKKITV